MNEQLNEILADVFNVDKNILTDDLTQDQIPEWDSLAHLRLITCIEEEMKIALTMEEIQSLDSVGKIREIVKKKL